MALRSVGLGTKNPVPEVLHSPEFVAPITCPFSGISSSVTQVKTSSPAITSGAGSIEMVRTSDSGRQSPFPVEVSVS